MGWEEVEEQELRDSDRGEAPELEEKLKSIRQRAISLVQIQVLDASDYKQLGTVIGQASNIIGGYTLSYPNRAPVKENLLKAITFSDSVKREVLGLDLRDMQDLHNVNETGEELVGNLLEDIKTYNQAVKKLYEPSLEVTGQATPAAEASRQRT